MVLTYSQQLTVAFAAVMCGCLVFPRMFGGGTGSKDPRAFEPHFSRKVGPGPLRGHQVNMDTGSGKGQSFENIQQMRKMMEQEIKSERLKANNKGYVFTLMPLYAIGVGVFAVYKFLKIKSSESQTGKEKTSKGAKKSEETENQLNELEQRLAQTEKMLNSILTQLDPLTTCVESVAFEQKNEIMAQLHSIRQLMKKRGMDFPPLNPEEPPCGKNLEDILQSMTAQEEETEGRTVDKQDVLEHQDPDTSLGAALESEEDKNSGSDHHMASLESSFETNIENVGAININSEEVEETGLRRRNRHE
uniref:Coiled-coil domain containing 107 n=1 Tax=Lepisosteus oculatus TaxID=7918 RepID=W5NHE4_LEPOC|nr:PREDICTED: coiled-coil domain-containing protein 107 [Lepisosteus oculatus]